MGNASLEVRRGGWRRLPLVLLLAGALVACEEEQAEVVERVRAIKTITVSERASGQQRKFSGVVEAVDTSALSFEVSGNVQALEAEVGDKIARGQVMAVMDEKTFRLNVESAEADLGRARADQAEKKTEFDRQNALFKKGWVAKSAQEQALAAYESAQNQVRYSISQLNLAKRDLEKTQLMAPFDGVVAKRHIDPFAEVSRGQPIYDVYAEGAMEVKISVPESSINDLHLGLPAEVRFPTGRGLGLGGRVSEVGTQAETANAFPVKVALEQGNDGILPGMTAEVSLLLGGDDREQAYLVPISAIAPGEEPNKGYVFVFDPESSTVKRTVVAGGGVRDNQIVVTEGIRAGDIIAVAGVSFLADGQEVKLLSAP